MKTKLPLHKLIVPILVIGSMLLTAFTAQAASTKFSSNPASGGLTASVQRIGSVGAKLSSLLAKELSKSASKNEVQPAEGSTGNGSDLESENGENNEDQAEIENEHEITGTVTAVMSDTWTIGGVSVMIDASTEIESGLGIGSVVKAEGETQSDGSFLAREIQAFDQKSNEGESHENDDSAAASGDSHQSEDGSENSAQLAGSPVEFTGQLSAINGNTWTVNGMSVMVSAATEIKDNPQVGSMVKVEGVREASGSIQARQVKLVSSRDSNGDDHSSSQDGQNNTSSTSGSSSSSGRSGDGHDGSDGSGDH